MHCLLLQIKVTWCSSSCTQIPLSFSSRLESHHWLFVHSLSLFLTLSSPYCLSLPTFSPDTQTFPFTYHPSKKQMVSQKLRIRDPYYLEALLIYGISDWSERSPKISASKWLHFVRETNKSRLNDKNFLSNFPLKVWWIEFFTYQWVKKVMPNFLGQGDKLNGQECILCIQGAQGQSPAMYGLPRIPRSVPLTLYQELNCLYSQDNNNKKICMLSPWWDRVFICI